MTLRTRLPDRLTSESTAPSLLVVSDSRVGATLAADIDAIDIHLVADCESDVARVPDAVRTTVGDVTTLETLATADADEATAAVLALGSDRRALLVAQLLRTRFGVDDVVALLNDPERHDALTDTGVTVVCASSCLAAALGDAVQTTLSEPSSHS